LNLTPGSPYERARAEVEERAKIAGKAPPPESHWARLDALLGLDKPVHIRYILWLRSVFSGDFGETWSIGAGQDVFDVISARLPYSLVLMFTAALLAFAIALPTGIYSAMHPYSEGDMLITGCAFFGIAMPSFWFGILLISLFSGILGWLPAFGAASSGLPVSGDFVTVLAKVFSLGTTHKEIAGYEGLLFLDGMKHLLLPTVALAVLLMARWNRYVRSSFREVLGQDFIRTARAKGASERRIMYRHILRIAIIPLVTIIALDIPFLFTGAFIIEIVFAWPGIGRLYIDGLRAADWPLLHGLLILNAFLIIFANFFADIYYGVLDPRVKLTRSPVE